MSSTIPAARQVRPNVTLTAALMVSRHSGVPQWAVAKEAGISPALLSMIARGRAACTHENAYAIAAALGRDVGELFPDLAEGRGV